MSRMQNVQDMVETLLWKDETCRKDDDYLYVRLVAMINPELIKKPFGQLMLHREYHGIPKFESVRRARQKLQRDNPKLRPSDDVMAGRMLEEERMRDYARSV